MFTWISSVYSVQCTVASTLYSDVFQSIIYESGGVILKLEGVNYQDN
jgi:hypothetical protein